MSGAHGIAGELLAPQRRAELERLLTERAALLAPSAELIDRAVARCIRHDLRARARTDADGAAAARAHGASAQAARERPASDDDLAPFVPEDEAIAFVETPPVEEADPTDATRVAAAPTGAPAVVTGEATEADSRLAPAQRAVATGDGIPAGRVIAGYRIEGPLGKGGMGQVYRATQLSVQRSVAFKVLSPRLASDPEFRARFVREARAAGRLHHHHLIAVHDVGEADGLMFFSMELVDGRTVKQLIGDAGRLTPEKALPIAAQALRALQYAHAHGVIHRDIKPDNLMIAADGTVKVADLGLSRVEPGPGFDAAATQSGAMMGTPHYMAPEQSRDARQVDARADLYSLGATLYHMVCGRTPFVGTSPVDVAMRAATEPLVFPEDGPPPALRAVIARLMAKTPDERYPDAASALSAIERLGIGESPENSRRMRHLRRRRLRRLTPTTIGVAVGAVALLALVVVLARPSADERAWRRDRDLVTARVEAGDFAGATALAATAASDAAPGSPRARRVAELAEEVAKRWDTASLPRIQPALQACDAAMADEDATTALEALDLDEDGLSPKARGELSSRREEITRALVEAQRSAPGPRDTGDPVRERLFVRNQEMMWRAFAWEPAASAERGERGVRLVGAGSGEWTLPQRRLDGRSIGVHLAFPAGPPRSDERVRLRLGDARIEVTAAGAVLTAASGASQTAARTGGGIVIRLRRGSSGWDAAVGSNAWLPLGAYDPRIRLEWSLAHGHTCDISAVIVPHFDRR